MDKPANNEKLTSIAVEEIPSEIALNGFTDTIKFSERDRNALAKGEETSLLENLELDSGKIISGKFRIFKDEDANLKFSFFEKKERLVIPRRWQNKELSKEQMQALKKGEFVGPFKQKSTEYYLKVDSQLNSVVIKLPHQTNASPPKSVGYYVLTAEDKNLLANGKPMGTHVFISPDKRTYFLGNFFIDAKTGERGFHNAQVIKSKKRALELIEIYNRPQISMESNPVQSITETALETTQPVKSAQLSSSHPDFSHYAKYGDVKLLIDSVDLTMLSEIHNQGFSLSEPLLHYISQHPTLSADDKAHIFMACGEKADNLFKLSVVRPSLVSDDYFQNVNDNLKEYHVHLINKERNPHNNKTLLPEYDQDIIARSEKFLAENKANRSIELYHAIRSLDSKSVSALCKSTVVEDFHLDLVSYLSKSLSGEKLALQVHANDNVDFTALDNKLKSLSEIDKALKRSYNTSQSKLPHSSKSNISKSQNQSADVLVNEDKDIDVEPVKGKSSKGKLLESGVNKARNGLNKVANLTRDL